MVQSIYSVYFSFIIFIILLFVSFSFSLFSIYHFHKHATDRQIINLITLKFLHFVGLHWQKHHFTRSFNWNIQSNYFDEMLLVLKTILLVVFSLKFGIFYPFFSYAFSILRFWFLLDFLFPFLHGIHFHVLTFFLFVSVIQYFL